MANEVKVGLQPTYQEMVASNKRLIEDYKKNPSKEHDAYAVLSIMFPQADVDRELERLIEAAKLRNSCSGQDCQCFSCRQNR